MNLSPSVALRVAAAGVVIARLAGAASTRPPVAPATGSVELDAISVVVPARDEATRIGPLLSALENAPGVVEIVVVDDESSDGTAEVARHAGARVVAGMPRPPGWAGKAWALHQGVEAAIGEWVVVLDADTRPDPRLPAAIVARARADATDLLSVAGRFECPTRGTRWLHAAMLTTLVYRFGPPGRRRRPGAGRTFVNGQCLAFDRERLIDVGALTAVAGDVVEDVALARHLAGREWSVDFLDAAELLTVRPYESLVETWSGWGRSIGLPGVESRGRQLLECIVLTSALVAPSLRLAVRRADPIDLVLVAARFGTLVGTRRAYDQAEVGYWLSPLADVLAVTAVVAGGFRRRQTWRGRRYWTRSVRART